MDFSFYQIFLEFEYKNIFKMFIYNNCLAVLIKNDFILIVSYLQNGMEKKPPDFMKILHMYVNLYIKRIRKPLKQIRIPAVC